MEVMRTSLSLPRLIGYVALAAAAITVGLMAARDDGPSAIGQAATSPVLPASDGFASVVDRASPSVVQIRSAHGLGSGVVWDDAGRVVTNAHVVAGATRFEITDADGSTHTATLRGVYPQGDLAVVDIQGASPPPASFADSSKVRTGDYALAIGNPLGLRSSVTLGIISSTSRTVHESAAVALPAVLQTSAEINPGNSGGALVDANGAVIGVPTLAALDPQMGGSQAPGIGFAIASNTVRSIAPQLIRDGHVTSPGGAPASSALEAR
jgi:S1-C subfamily serine protease